MLSSQGQALSLSCGRGGVRPTFTGESRLGAGRGSPARLGPRAGTGTPQTGLFLVPSTLMWDVGFHIIYYHGLTSFSPPSLLGFFFSTSLQKGRRVVSLDQSRVDLGEGGTTDDLLGLQEKYRH